MSVNFNNSVSQSYQFLHQKVKSLEMSNNVAQLEQKINDLTSYIHKNLLYLSEDLRYNQSHSNLYSDL